jgi:queuine tRNA-ribosyltransferase
VKPPLPQPVDPGTLAPEVVITRSGAKAIRDKLTGELMHPVVGPLIEAERLYVGPSRLRERLVDGAKDPLVLLDVGLGAGSNAIAAFSAAAAAPPGARPLRIVSFDRSLDALALALDDEHARAFGFEGEALTAGRALLRDGVHVSAHTRWELVEGELLETLSAQKIEADVVYWDPFSSGVNPALWTVHAFELLRPLCRGGVTVHTYGGATSTRAALLLAGFCVGEGELLGEVKASGKGKRGTVAALDPRDLLRPLDRRWLERLARSSAPLPSDAPSDALARIHGCSQFSESS